MAEPGRKRHGRLARPPARSPEAPQALPDRELTLIGTPFRRVDGWAKVTGATRFADDLSFPRQCFIKLVRSTVPHARSALGGLFCGARDARSARGADRQGSAGHLRHPAGVAGRASAGARYRAPRRRSDRRGGGVVRGSGARGGAGGAWSSTNSCRRSRRSRRRSPLPSRRSTPTPTTAISTSSCRWSSATSRPASPRRTGSSRTLSSTRATPTCRWSSTPPWRCPRTTAGSPSGRRPRRRTTSIAR